MGPNFFTRKFCLPIKIRSYIMHFMCLLIKNLWKVEKTGFSLVHREMHWKWGKMTLFPNFSPIFAKQIYKMHETWSDLYVETKILRKNFWSHGTPLGSLGSGSWADLHLGFCGLQILVVGGLYNYPELVACETQAENPKPVQARCGKSR